MISLLFLFVLFLFITPSSEGIWIVMASFFLFFPFDQEVAQEYDYGCLRTEHDHQPCNFTVRDQLWGKPQGHAEKIYEQQCRHPDAARYPPAVTFKLSFSHLQIFSSGLV